MLGTVTYGYDSDWSDKLVSYGGQPVVSDEIGNMTSGRGHSYTWKHGRELETLTKGTTTWTYSYDAGGMRTSRGSSTKTYNYVYNGSKLTQMTVGAYTLNFSYDASGTPMTLTFNGTTFYYVTNLQGDVVSILKADGTEVVHYTYDAWGVLLSTTGTMAGSVGYYNPLRYRGYVYDRETSLYYLQSRYYDPQIGRFISADAFVSTGQGLLGNNMFAYCLNNPIIYADDNGSAAILLLDENFPGHIGVLVQDEEGNWWHFYWGAAGLLEALGSVIGLFVKVNTWCVLYTGDISLDAINQTGQYGGTYTKCVYLEGDFSTVVEDFKNMEEEYHLYVNNCSQVTLRNLANADTSARLALQEASKEWYPERAYAKFILYMEIRQKVRNRNRNIIPSYSKLRQEAIC